MISFNDDDNEIKAHIAKTSVIARNSNTDNDHDQIDKKELERRVQAALKTHQQLKRYASLCVFLQLGHRAL